MQGEAIVAFQRVCQRRASAVSVDHFVLVGFHGLREGSVQNCCDFVVGFQLPAGHASGSPRELSIGISPGPVGTLASLRHGTQGAC